MSFQIKQNGTWKDAQDIYAKKDGSWNQASEVYRKQNGSWCLVFQAAECNFTVDPQFTNFDSLGVAPTAAPSPGSGFPEIRAELTIDNSTYGTDGSLDASNFQVCEDNTIEAVTNVNFATGSGSKLDLVIVMDDTGSLTNEISDIKDSLTGSSGLIQNIENEGFDARYALISYSDVEEIDQKYTTNSSTFESAINNLIADGGLDTPEDGVDALGVALGLKSADSGDGSLGNFRDEAQKVIIQPTDVGSHKVGENSNDTTTISQSQVENEINNKQVQYFAIAPQSPFSDSSVSHKDIAQNVENGEYEEFGSADFQSIFNSIVEGVTQASYRIFYNTSNGSTDGSTRTTQIKVIPPADSPDDNMVVERSYSV